MRATITAAVLGATLACSIPDTLGLPCHEHAHCNAGQHCGSDGTCVNGDPVAETSTSLAGTSSGTGTATLGSSGTSTGVAETTAATGSEAGSSTTAPMCGAAIGTCDALDVLIVVDSSGSMTEEFAEFIPALSNFADLLEEVLAGPCSYHIGITSTEPAPDFQARACQLRGALSKSGALVGGASCFGDEAHPPYVTETDDISTLGCLFAVGQNYADDEKQLDTAIAAISPDLAAPGACNEGFLRDDAALVVVLITDEDDDDDSMTVGENANRTGSQGDPAEWFTRIGEIKPAASTGVLALVPTDEDVCAPWMPEVDDDGTGAEFAARILTFMQHYSGVGLADHIYAGNICLPTDELLAQIGQITAVIEAVCADHEPTR